ncbi:MAG: hypothetical protein M1838_006025 [Thelocarpon superellum]|nr:MAG: hypothetical protein M1838_006025 [Thelocarpon superellum]
MSATAGTNESNIANTASTIPTIPPPHKLDVSVLGWAFGFPILSTAHYVEGSVPKREVDQQESDPGSGKRVRLADSLPATVSPRLLESADVRERRRSFPQSPSAGKGRRYGHHKAWWGGSGVLSLPLRPRHRPVESDPVQALPKSSENDLPLRGKEFKPQQLPKQLPETEARYDTLEQQSAEAIQALRARVKVLEKVAEDQKVVIASLRSQLGGTTVLTPPLSPIRQKRGVDRFHCSPPPTKTPTHPTEVLSELVPQWSSPPPQSTLSPGHEIAVNLAAHVAFPVLLTSKPENEPRPSKAGSLSNEDVHIPHHRKVQSRVADLDRELEQNSFEDVIGLPKDNDEPSL